MQANFLEAYSARRQAENTAKQVKASTKIQSMMAEQALESGKQGKTLMVFTVVTIIFVCDYLIPDPIPMFSYLFYGSQLPSSFLAAVFAINLDSLPQSDDGRLPTGYFLTYLCECWSLANLYLGIISRNRH